MCVLSSAGSQIKLRRSIDNRNNPYVLYPCACDLVVWITATCAFETCSHGYKKQARLSLYFSLKWLKIYEPFPRCCAHNEIKHSLFLPGTFLAQAIMWTSSLSAILVSRDIIVISVYGRLCFCREQTAGGSAPMSNSSTCSGFMHKALTTPPTLFLLFCGATVFRPTWVCCSM